MDAVRRAEALVDLTAIRDNVAVLAERAGSAEVMAVVKADGYGHGIVPAARAALAGGATWLGVATLDEALTLRAAGITARLLSWLAVPGERYDDAITADIEVAAYASWQLEEITAAAARRGMTARVQLKADTGLGRGGATATEWRELVRLARKAESDGLVTVTGVYSHLARADEPGHPSVRRQLEVFRTAVAEAERAGLRPEVRHLANSAATLTEPATHFDLVRPGIAVYGLTPAPSAGSSADFGLRPAMTLRARLALVKRVPAGSGVSYGHQYVTRRDTTLGLVPLGYADGVPRAAGNRVPVWVAGRRRTIAGTVCMDQFVVDLEGDEASPGEEVVLFGPGIHGEPTAQDWAELLGTIAYEIVSRVGARAVRTYIGKLDP